MNTPHTDPAPVTLEGILETLDRVAKGQEETNQQMKETDRRMKETDRQMEETARHLKQIQGEADRQRKEADRRLRRAEDLFTSQWGRLVESLVEGDLLKLLRERGVKVEAVYSRLRLECGPYEREVDLLATNGDEVVAVEVKTTLRPPDVDRFLDLLAHPALLRHVRGRRLYGGVAYLREHQGTSRYAGRKGLFVIRATGNSASIVNPPEFRPRDFVPPTG